jgi:ABC-type uncharacterized transport system ATPase subunit
VNAPEPLPQGLEPEALLRVKGLHKRFGEVVANDDISFEVRAGEIHCLLGENGAGKSTLTECIFGLYQPDAGRISLRDKALGTGNPQDAIAAGVGMVHQHFVLAEPMTALENIIIGAPGEPLGSWPPHDWPSGRASPRRAAHRLPISRILRSRR